METITERTDEEKLNFYRSLVMAFLIRAGGEVTFEFKDWPAADKRYSVVDEMTPDKKLRITLIETEGEC
jgi:hypothetical protein